MQIPDESTLQRLEDHERAYGRETHEWIAEGMPTDIMGSPKSMEAFRQRQAERPPEVPTNIERQNRRSVLRSEKSAGESSPTGETGVPEPVRDVISSTGRSLDGTIQRAMEDRMGDSFGDVRIHTGSTAAEACESINARAFTVGNHIAFNSGEYDPSSPEGQHVLAHELAHVRQQTKGAVSMLPQENVELEVDPDPALEREAEEAAQQAMDDGPVVVNRMGTEMHVQRTPSEVSVENNYGTISDLVDQVDELQQQVSDNSKTINQTKSNLGELQDEVHSGLSEKAAGAVTAIGGSGLIAGSRAATEEGLGNTIAGSETLMEALPMLAQNPETAAATSLAAILGGGVYAAQQTVDGAGILEKIGGGFKSLKDRVSLFDDDEDGQREGGKESDEGGLLGKAGL